MLNQLFDKKVSVINAGIDSFYEDLKSQGVKVIQMNWRIPEVDEETLELIRQLELLD